MIHRKRGLVLFLKSSILGCWNNFVCSTLYIGGRPSSVDMQLNPNIMQIVLHIFIIHQLKESHFHKKITLEDKSKLCFETLQQMDEMILEIPNDWHNVRGSDLVEGQLRRLVKMTLQMRSITTPSKRSGSLVTYCY